MFTETETGVDAFALPAHNTAHALAELEDICAQFGSTLSVEQVELQNWNEEWESNFPKVVVDDWCAVRAEFHEPESGVQYDIVIRPKMAFGTGHHQTTRMMLGAMRHYPVKTTDAVFDYGCGTAVLAILAGMMGATDLVGVDNELPAAQNSVENAELNGIKMEVIHGTLDDVPVRTFDYILANINRNIILKSIDGLVERSKHGTLLFTSGYLVSDRDTILTALGEVDFEHQATYQIDDWICMVFAKKN